MSRETLEWLNTNVLVGFTEKRGRAWHHRQGADNHYTGPVPVEDVRKRLFDWTAIETPIMRAHETASGLVVPEGVIPGKKERYHSKTGYSFGIFNQDHQIHDYEEWLVAKVETILDDDLQIGTAGLLRHGGQAWVQVEVPETMEFAGGIKARPFLLAATSLDGSLSSTYGASVTNTVCDNTMAVAMGEHGGFRTKIRHSKKSLDKIQDVREALGIVHTVADDFGRQVEALLSQQVSDNQFRQLVASEVPHGKRPGHGDDKRAWAAWHRVEKKRDFLFDLYRFDERVAPWSGTALGAWQAFNTYWQHESAINTGTIRVERNAGWMVTGKQEKVDCQLLDKILELAA